MVVWERVTYDKTAWQYIVVRIPFVPSDLLGLFGLYGMHSTIPTNNITVPLHSCQSGTTDAILLSIGRVIATFGRRVFSTFGE